MFSNSDQDACELLDADHIAVKHLFVEYARLAHAMPADSRDRRTELAMQICRELTVHARIEAMGSAGPPMDELVAKLAFAIEHHVKEERDELFPKARSCGLDLGAVAAQLRERQRSLA